MDFSLKRHLTQICATILYNGNFFGLGKIVRANKVCVPGLNCAYCPGAIAGCPLGTLQNLFTTGLTRIPFYMLASILLIALLLGRIICGWLCPFGLLEDLLYKIPTPKISKNKYTGYLSYLKYFIFAVAVVIVPLYFYYTKNRAFPAFCEELCPNGLLNGLLMIFTGTGSGFGYALVSDVKLVIAIAILLGSVFIFRLFCRFICPLGAFYSVFNKLSVFAMRIDEDKCIGCNACKRACLMDCKTVGDGECIACGKCAKACPVKAIKLASRY